MADLKPNERQQQAIDKLNGSVMLLAGPGTGKTFTVIRRIEKMLQDGVSPDSILCLTFSDAAANEMRQRLIKKMGVVASSVDIYTYHSFCNTIIKTYPSQFDLGTGVRLILDNEKIKYMRECIDELDFKCFVPTWGGKYHFVKDFISNVEKLKTRRVDKNTYMKTLEDSELVKQKNHLEQTIAEREENGNSRNKTLKNDLEKVIKNIGKARELWNVYELYTTKMLSNNLIDFSDMINFVLDAFDTDKKFLSKVSNKYRYFLVDEYQDTNELQNSIIFNLVDGNDEKNVFVVGDDDQIIYGFQGARIDTIEKFLKKYPETTVICLEESNRSTQSILDFSYAVIGQDENRLEENKQFKNKNINKKLTAKNKEILLKEKEVKRIQFGDKLQEMNYISDEINNLVNSDSCPVDNDGNKKLSEIAIITKKRADLRMFAEILKGKNIPVQIDEGKSIFSIRSSILIYFYLKVLMNNYLSSDKLFGLMLSEPFKLDLDDYNKILHEQKLLSHGDHNDFISLMRSLSGWKNPQKIKEFLKTFEYLQGYVTSNSLRSSVIEVINRTGILQYFHSHPNNKMENLMGIKKIIDEATDFSNYDTTSGMNDFVLYLDDCIQNEIDVQTEKNTTVQNAIQLTTYHSSKGREFEVVYLPDVVAQNWEKFSMPGEYKLITDEEPDKELEDEKKDSELLKLLFVGITRAKHTLTVSFADMNNGKSQQITKYLAELKDFPFEMIPLENETEGALNEYVRVISRDVYDNQKAFENEIKERVKNIVLSASSMNNYINCPRAYFYGSILGIDLSEADWDNANFGTLIHSLLENAVRVGKETGEYPEIDSVKQDFLKGLDRTRFTTEEVKEKFLKRGLAVISNYYPHFKALPVTMVEDVEVRFDGVDVEGDFIKGCIDRIEKNHDGTYSLYDYKTGRPVSVNQVALGKAKEGYYNQLCFYKYAFEKMTNNNVSRVGIIYVEDHEHSVYPELSSEDVEYIENKIKETYSNIKALKFEPTPDDKSDCCKYCAYKHLCKLDIL